LFGLFKKKSSQDRYLDDVAESLHKTLAPILPRQNAVNLAAECFSDLQQQIAHGMFRQGPNPREVLMAYYCLCNMVRESGSGGDKLMVLRISTMAQVLANKFNEQHELTALEKGIFLYGKETLKEYLPNQSKSDLEDLKRKASNIVFEFASANGASLSSDQAATLINNVCANISETDICRGGEKILAISALTSMTAYSIDQGDIDEANTYFASVNAALKNYRGEQEKSFNDYQSNALRTIILEYGSVVQELKDANNRAAEH